jgi:hypothetical protein
VDRSPPAPGSNVIGTIAAQLKLVSGSPTLKITSPAYPPFPANFMADAVVVWLWSRFERYRAGREPLPSMAYACLSFLEHRFEGREAAAKVLAVESKVLNTIGNLCTNRGDALSARKLKAKPRPFSAFEQQWLDEALRALIRRCGEIAAGQSPPELTLKSLPALE